MSRADGRTRVWRRPGERYSDTAVIQRDRWGGQCHDLGWKICTFPDCIDRGWMQ